MLNLSEIQKETEKLNNWNLEFGSITKDFKFTNFNESKLFISKISELAEKQSHFPTITWDNLLIRISLATRSQKGLTEQDFILAREIDKVYKQ